MRIQSIIWVVVILGFAIGVFFFGRSTVNIPKIIDNSGKIAELENALKISMQREDSLSLVIFNLKEEKKKVKKETQQAITEIDVEIEKDSLQAITQFRNNLFLLDVMPDQTEYISYREAGFGAKFLRELLGKRIELDICERTLIAQDEESNELRKQLDVKDGLLFYSNQSTEYYKEQYDHTQGFFYRRFIIYLGAGVNYDGLAIKPGLQLGVGISLWSNE